MPTEIKKEIQLEIAHVLFIDIVGYSKLLIDEQFLKEHRERVSNGSGENSAKMTFGELQ
jgi:hypothetical protein